MTASVFATTSTPTVRAAIVNLGTAATDTAPRLLAKSRCPCTREARRSLTRSVGATAPTPEGDNGFLADEQRVTRVDQAKSQQTHVAAGKHRSTHL